jgi:hypothetical protein
MSEIGKIILDGKEVEVGAPVVTWNEHGMTWTKTPNVIPRELDPDLIIWHWTGGENSPEGFYGTLNNRGLGITFYITREGFIYQFADPCVFDPKDTGGAMGRRSISLEIANYGFLVPRGKDKTGRGSDRVVDRGIRIHGVKYDVARFYPQQIHTVAALTKVLCEELGIPRQFPREKDGSLALRELTNQEKRSFKGIIGHFHKTDQKADPGYHIFHELEYLSQP